MARGAVARRYAKALFELAREDGSVPKMRQELADFAELLESNDELREVLLTPLHPVAQRRKVLDAVADKLGAGDVLKHFYAYLIDQRRLVDVESIQTEYERLADREAGLVRASVKSAAPLSESQLAELRRALAARTGSEVELDVEQDPTLIGGVVAKVGDLVFDGSLRTQLDQLRQNLTGE